MQAILAEMGLTVVDIVVGAILLYGLIRGVFRGFSGELLRAIGLLLIGLVVRVATPTVSGWIAGMGQVDPGKAEWIGFLVALGLGIGIVLLLRLAVKKVLKLTFPNGLERVGGALAGLLIAAVLSAAGLLLAANSPWPSVRHAVCRQSWIGPRACELCSPLYDSLADRYPLPRAPSETENDDENAPPPVQDAEDPGRGF